MAWSSIYSSAGSTNAEAMTFWTYFLDTYLGTKLGWTVSAHPTNPGADKRSIQISLPSPWAGGSNVTSYFWISFNSTTAPTTWNWYEDATYTTTPGDLGTDNTNNWSASGWNGVAGTWRIWECTSDTEAILVTKGKSIMFFWPGPSQWFTRPDTTWDGSADNKGSQWGPYINLNNSNLIASPNYPWSTSGTSTTEYYLSHDVGHNIGTYSLGGTGFNMIKGVQWVVAQGSATNIFPSFQSQPVIPRTGADIAVFLPDNITNNNRILQHGVGGSTVLYDPNNSKYWLIGNNALDENCLAWDMGATEPDFS